mmetsp:Transcript_56021/g.114520  ORF Transcript_56021/g.114520 Transcript_56021/m.114520 type:complete len:130 (-) Transcript_56021:1017-1406(-)
MEQDMGSSAHKKRTTIKGTLRVKGQATSKVPLKRCDLPPFCERCRKKTMGSLQLPCGRQVRLCEACSLEFYDILMEKITQNDGKFQEFLKEQRRKEQENAKKARIASKPPSAKLVEGFRIKTKAGIRRK